MTLAPLPGRLRPPPPPARCYPEEAERELRGGRVLQVTVFRRAQAVAWIWCVHPLHEGERAIPVWNDGPLPKLGDFVWWKPGESPQWLRGPKHVAFLPRVGRSVDPVTRKP